jgi:nicotinamide mononucleotide transporter
MEILTPIVTYFSGTWGMVELLGTVFSLICVFLAARHNQWTWVFGALGVIFFGALFYEFKLYSDAGLQILFFLPMQVWGFFVWQKLAAEADDQLVTRSLTSLGSLLIIVSIAVLTIANGYLMATYTDASFAYADAWTTWMSVFAQVLMIRKFWQSWAFWVVMDIGAIYIYFAKGLFVVSGLYVVFLCMASYGLIRWYLSYREQASPELQSVAV